MISIHDLEHVNIEHNSSLYRARTRGAMTPKCVMEYGQIRWGRGSDILYGCICPDVLKSLDLFWVGFEGPTNNQTDLSKNIFF